MSAELPIDSVAFRRAEIRAEKRKLARERWRILIVFIAMLLSTFGVAQVVARIAYDRGTSKFHADTQPLAYVVERRVEKNVNLLLAARGLFAASVHVDREEFRDFINSIEAAQNLPFLEGAFYVHRVAVSEKNLFIEHVRHDKLLDPAGYPDFTIYPDKAADDQYVVKYAAITPNREILGFDVASYNPLREVLDRAASSGQVVVSRTMPLLVNMPPLLSEQPAEPEAVLLVAPIYQNHVLHNTEAERIAALNGFVVFAVRIKSLLQDIWKLEPEFKGLTLEFYYGEVPTAENLVYSYPSLEENISNEVASEQTLTVSAAKRNWTLRFTASHDSQWFAGVNTLYFLTLIVGGLLSALFTLLLFYSYIMRRRLLAKTEHGNEQLSRSNDLLNSIMDNVPIGLFVKDGKTLVVSFWNREMERITDTPRESILGKTGYEVFPREEMEGYLRDDNKALKETKLVVVEEEMTTPAGRGIKLLTRKVPVSSDDSGAKFLLGISEDVTEQSKERERYILKQKLETLGNLSAGVAHEINTPLQYITVNLEYLRDSLSKVKNCVDPETFTDITEAVEQSLQGSSKVSAIVKAMGVFEAGQEGKVRVAVSALVENAVLVTAHHWKKVGTLEVKLPEDLGALVCHPGEITQVLIGVIMNAIDAIKERDSGEKGSIVISGARQDNTLTLSVSDNGVGISEEHEEKIFEPFFSTKTTGQFSGQGLSISLSIVADRHSGKLWHTSEYGRGSTFFIELPLEPIDDPAWESAGRDG